MKNNNKIRSTEGLEMEFNRWCSKFMHSLRKFYKMNDLIFVYSKEVNLFDVGSDKASLLYRGDGEKYFHGDFEKMINKHWFLSPTNAWTRIQMYVEGRVVYFAKLLDITTHLCDHNCLISAKSYSDHFLIEDSICEQTKDRSARAPSFLDVKLSNIDISVLLEFNEGMVLPPLAYDITLLRYKKLSPVGKPPVCATKGSLGYDLFSAVHKSIASRECNRVATDIALVVPHGVYPRIAPRSSMALKNTDVGNRAVDTDYEGNMKVLIMNHNVENYLHIEPGDKIA